MLRYYSAVLFFSVLLISSTVSASVHVVFFPKIGFAISNTEVSRPSPFERMSITDFLLLTPQKYKALTGKKMSLSQKVSLKFSQYKVKKMMKKNKMLALPSIAKDIDTNGFNIVGFILGIALGPIGLLIAYLISGKNSSLFKSAIYGGLIWLGIFLLVVLI